MNSQNSGVAVRERMRAGGNEGSDGGGPRRNLLVRLRPAGVRVGMRPHLVRRDRSLRFSRECARRTEQYRHGRVRVLDVGNRPRSFVLRIPDSRAQQQRDLRAALHQHRPRLPVGLGWHCGVNAHWIPCPLPHDLGSGAAMRDRSPGHVPLGSRRTSLHRHLQHRLRGMAFFDDRDCRLLAKRGPRSPGLGLPACGPIKSRRIWRMDACS